MIAAHPPRAEDLDPVAVVRLAFVAFAVLSVGGPRLAVMYASSDAVLELA